MLGEVIADNGDPVFVALNLRPDSQINDLVVVMSAYSRSKNNIQNLLNTSDILYDDTNKKRVNDWLQLIRLQLPSDVTQYGSIGKVTYYEPNVNNENRYSKKNSAGNSLTDETEWLSKKQYSLSMKW